MIRAVDIIFGLCWGDEGKGKISAALSKNYDFVCRWNGGPNAGHTVYLKGKKYKTHLIPSGIFYGKKCVIGPNCVINLNKFFEEIDYLKKEGFNTDLIKVSPKAHIITEKHIEYDLNILQKKLGTTGQGIAPAYADKALRIGSMAKDFLDKKYIWNGELYGDILCEGAQSFWLDINYGDYPYVTSSETLPYGACSLGFSPKYIREIIGVAKIYDTKSGIDPLFPESLWTDETLNKIIEIGQEFGSTTGRKRIVNWLRLDKLSEAINKSGVNKLIINKCDVLESINKFVVLFENPKSQIEFINLDEMKRYIKNYIKENALGECEEVIFSGDKSKI